MGENNKKNDNKENLIQLYEIIQKKEEFYHQRADDDPQHVINFIIVILAAMIGVEYFGAQNSMDNNFYVLYYLVPIVTSYGIVRECFYSRFVAILRGYSKYLEEELNSCLSQELLFWDKDYFDEFMSPKKFKTYYASTVSFALGFVLPNAYSFYIQWINYGNKSRLEHIIWVLIWGISTLISLIALLDMLRAEKIRNEAYQYAKKYGVNKETC